MDLRGLRRGQGLRGCRGLRHGRGLRRRRAPIRVARCHRRHTQALRRGLVPSRLHLGRLVTKHRSAEGEGRQGLRLGLRGVRGLLKITDGGLSGHVRRRRRRGTHLLRRGRLRLVHGLELRQRIGDTLRRHTLRRVRPALWRSRLRAKVRPGNAEGVVRVRDRGAVQPPRESLTGLTDRHRRALLDVLLARGGGLRLGPRALRVRAVRVRAVRARGLGTRRRGPCDALHEGAIHMVEAVGRGGLRSGATGALLDQASGRGRRLGGGRRLLNFQRRDSNTVREQARLANQSPRGRALDREIFCDGIRGPRQQRREVATTPGAQALQGARAVRVEGAEEGEGVHQFDVRQVRKEGRTSGPATSRRTTVPAAAGEARTR